ncbi:unnamed protein product [Aureobasidium pullulans]|nr:unnamed protein product [Aureobasidium pullulans]
MANSSTPNPNAPDNGSRATYTENLPRRLRSSGPIAGSSSSATAGSSSSLTAGSTSSLTAGSTSSTTAGSTSSIVPPHDPAVPTPAPPSAPVYFRCDKAIEDGTQYVRNHGARADRGNNSRSSSSTLARSIQTFHASKPRNKLADTDEIESPLLG